MEKEQKVKIRNIVMLGLAFVIGFVGLVAAITAQPVNSPTGIVQFAEQNTTLFLNWTAIAGGNGTVLNGTHGHPLLTGVSAGAVGQRTGFQILLNQNVSISGITKKSDDLSSTGFIMDSQKNNLASCTFTDSYCEFSAPVNLSIGTNATYWIAGGGGSVSRRRTNTIDYGQLVGDAFNWTNGLETGETTVSNDIWTILSVNVSEQPRLSTCFYDYNGVNNTLPECANQISVSRNSTFGANVTSSLVFYSNSTDGVLNATFVDWEYNIFRNTNTFNATTFQTARERYFTNITFNSTRYTGITTNFIFNGTRIASTTGDTGDERVFSATTILPTDTQNRTKNFYWNFILTNATATVVVNSTFSTQVVGNLSFDLALTDKFLNITFINETIAQENITAFIPDSTFFYWLGDDATINKTLSLSELTESGNFKFGSNVPSRSLNVNFDLEYDNSVSEQRSFSQTTVALTNVTTHRGLFLLPSSTGAFTRYKTVDTAGNVISGVLGEVQRDLASTVFTVATGTTDDSGLVTFFLDPDVSYDYTFSKSGFPDNTFTLTPNSPDIYTVIMGTSGTIGNGTQVFSNSTVTITPLNSSLRNNTVYEFGFNVTTSETISNINFTIFNSTGVGVASAQGNAPFISANLNTGNGTTHLIGRYRIVTPTETTTFTKRWVIAEEFIGDYSIFRQFSLFLDYEFMDFIRILLVLASIIGVLIFLSTNELLDTSESKVMVATLMIWAFSVVGWLNTGLVSTTSTGAINQLAQFGNQYGIAIVSTAFSMYFVLRRVFT